MSTPVPAASERLHPTAGSPRGTFVGRVVENRHLCTDHYRLILRVENFPPSTPGQFVQLDCRETESISPDDQSPSAVEWTPGCKYPGTGDQDFASPVSYLRRPFSIADHRVQPDGSAEIDIIHRVVGRGTSRLKRLEPNQEISLLGPLGIGFAIPADVT